jgi:hypothetical protein
MVSVSCIDAEFQLDFGMTVLLMATAIPFCFWEFPSQEVLEPLGLSCKMFCLIVDFKFHLFEFSIYIL